MNLMHFYSLLSFTILQLTLQQSRRGRRGSNPPLTRNIPISVDDCPLGIQVRKEYRDMSPQEWQTFREALMTLQTSPSPDGGDYSEWDWLTRVHLDYVPVAHEYHNTAIYSFYFILLFSHPAFLPWHRLFVSVVEKRLQEVNPSITIPYWDWSFDWSNPLKSPIFFPELGLDVQVGSRGDCRYRRRFPRQHCLIRNYNPRNFTAFYPSETIDAVVRSARDFDQIRQRIEWVPHGLVHAAVGGPEGDMTAMHSTNDPIFWLHHANVDRLWWNWQQSGIKNSTSSRRSSIVNPFTDYRGRTNEGVRVRITDMVNPFGLTINQTFSTESLCYTYQPFSQWNTSGRQHKRPSRGFFLPDPIPGSWIRMHGMNIGKFRKVESILVQLMAVQQQQSQHSSLQEALKVEIDENDQIITNQ